MKLEFPSFDGRQHARVGHGVDCVVVMIETSDYRPGDRGIVLTATEAAALGRRLIQQARASQLDHDGQEPRGLTSLVGGS